jgi:hypothetical protein
MTDTKYSLKHKRIAALNRVYNQMELAVKAV